MTTTRYDLHEISYSTQGWDSVLATDMQKLDDVIQSRITATLGETVSAYDTLYLNANNKFYKAIADGSSQPALGLAVEGGDLDDEIRLHVMGEITNTSWTWATPGAKLYLSTTVSGAITDVEPGSNIQAVGYSLSATKIMFSSVFQNIGDYSTNAALTNVSGSLQGQIDALDFYTTAEVDTISGTLHDEIISETKLFGTDSWRITVSGTDLLFQQWVTDEWITQTTISGS